MNKFLAFLRNNSWLVVILIAAACLRFYHADYQSLWLDEVLTMMDADPKQTFSEAFKSVMFWEQMPHLYFMVLKYFMAIFGFSSFNARIYSAFIGVLGVYAMYLFGKALYSKRTGLIAAAVTCVSVYHITYSQEARPYGMLFMFTAFAFYRLVLFVRNPNLKNALLFGLFSGLIINSHFFGVLTVGAQAVLVLFFLFQRPAEERKSFFMLSAAAAGAIIAVALLAYYPLMQITTIKSFWIPKPDPNAFTNIFKDYFGNAELLLFVVYALILYYLISVFRQKDSNSGVVRNKLIFSFVVMFVWLAFSLVIPIMKSYLQVSMILPRYFINTLSIFIIAIAIGAEQIKSSVVRNIAVISLVLFSLLDLFVVRDYYNKPSKCQMREMTTALKSSNTNNAKIITFYAWVFPYWFKDHPEMTFESKTFQDYIKGLRDKTIPEEPFWYASVNPYDLNAEDEKYLLDNFNRTKNFDYFDCWAYYYEPKNAGKPSDDGSLNLRTFQRAKFDEKGMTFTENGSVFSPFIDLEKGEYELTISGNSFPSPPIDNENARFKIKANGEQIAEIQLNDNPSKQDHKIRLVNTKYDKIRFQLVFDNVINNRKATIYSIKINKK